MITQCLSADAWHSVVRSGPPIFLLRTPVKPKVEVRWQDHVFAGGEYEPDRAHLVEQCSVGFLIRETKKVLVIAQTATKYPTGPRQYSEILTIDKRSSVKVRKL